MNSAFVSNIQCAILQYIYLWWFQSWPKGPWIMALLCDDLWWRGLFCTIWAKNQRLHLTQTPNVLVDFVSKRQKKAFNWGWIFFPDFMNTLPRYIMSKFIYGRLCTWVAWVAFRILSPKRLHESLVGINNLFLHFWSEEGPRLNDASPHPGVK